MSKNIKRRPIKKKEENVDTGFKFLKKKVGWKAKLRKNVPQAKSARKESVNLKLTVILSK